MTIPGTERSMSEMPAPDFSPGVGSPGLGEHYDLTFNVGGSRQLLPERRRFEKGLFDEILSLARYNDAAGIEEICRLGCAPDHGNKIGQSALHVACHWGSAEAVKALLSCKANPNVQNLKGCAPLHEAAHGQGPPYQRIQCIRLLIACKADPNHLDNQGDLPDECANDESVRLSFGAPLLRLHQAVKSLDAAELAKAIEHVQHEVYSAELTELGLGCAYYYADNSCLGTNISGIAYRRSKDLADKTAYVIKWGSLVNATEDGDDWLKVGELFLPKRAHGVDVLVRANKAQITKAHATLTLDTPNTAGETALMMAVTNRWQPGVEKLLAAGADTVVPLKRDRGRFLSLAHLAVQRGDTQILHLVLQARVDANTRDSSPDFNEGTIDKCTRPMKDMPWKHRTPLHYAAELGNLSAVRVLIEHEADPNVLDSKSETALHLCIAQRSSVQIEVGSGVRICGAHQRLELNGRLGSVVELQYANEGKSNGISQCLVLLEDGDCQGQITAEERNLELLVDDTLDVLLQARADVNIATSMNGEHCGLLHLAARMGDAALLEKLVAAGGQLEQRCGRQRLSPLHVSAMSKRYDAFRILVEARANIEERTAAGQTATDLAAAQGAPPELLASILGEAWAREYEQRRSKDGSRSQRKETEEWNDVDETFEYVDELDGCHQPIESQRQVHLLPLGDTNVAHGRMGSYHTIPVEEAQVPASLSVADSSDKTCENADTVKPQVPAEKTEAVQSDPDNDALEPGPDKIVQMLCELRSLQIAESSQEGVEASVAAPIKPEVEEVAKNHTRSLSPQGERAFKKELPCDPEAMPEREDSQPEPQIELARSGLAMPGAGLAERLSAPGRT